jgi:serine/threonine protein kinase/tetratricopeptide (TPR) repeat protein
MSIKCPKCQFDNPDTVHFCGECGTQLISKKEIPATETLETPTEELTRGTTFAGRYEIIEELGKGGMGKVYRVEDKKIKEEVALKLIKHEIASDKKTIERFSNELKMARKIAHRNVCRMFDLGEEKEVHYITMEYVRGEDLKSMIRMSKQLSVATSIDIAKQVCEGLAEAHRLGVIHRDLKPQNIMIDKEGNARIMDFGIARSIEAEGITEVGTIIGTPEYMSPEQVEGEEADTRSDIYSSGVILYEMVTGRVPFEGDKPLSVALKQKTETPLNPREVNDQIPEDLSSIILRCMEKDKGKRYQSVGELLSGLSKIKIRKLETGKVGEIKLKNSIAVLPFTDLSPKEDQEYFCDGMAEELINALSNIEGLQVASRTSSFQFREKGYDIQDIGKKLKVQTVLEGSVRKAGNRLRITVQLINVDEGYHIWSEKFDRDLEDIFAIQDEISLAIAEKLKVKLLEEEKEALVKRYTEDHEAYNLYLMGRYFWNGRYEGKLQKAIECFQQAINKDPLYAIAYAGIADCYNLLAIYGLMAPKEVYSKAEAAAKKALEIDKTLAEVHTSVGWIRTFFDWDWPVAENEFKKAIELNPAYATAHHWYALHLVCRGRFDEGVTEIKQAHELDPLSLIINRNLAWVYYFTCQYDQAIEQFMKTLEMDPNFIYTHLKLGWVYLNKSMYEEALAEFQKEKELSTSWNPFIEARIGLAYALMGKRIEAQQVLNNFMEQSKREYIPPYGLACIYFALRKNNQGFKWMEKGYEERDYWQTYLKVEPMFESLRSEPKFKALLKKMGLE